MGYVWTALRRMLPPEVTEDIRGMSLTKDDQGAVFDVPAKHMATLRAAMEQEEDSPVSICTSLPELKERNFSMGGGGGGFGGRGGGFGGRGRGFGESTKPAIVFLGGPRVQLLLTAYMVHSGLSSSFQVALGAVVAEGAAAGVTAVEAAEVAAASVEDAGGAASTRSFDEPV